MAAFLVSAHDVEALFFLFFFFLSFLHSFVATVAALPREYKEGTR